MYGNAFGGGGGGSAIVPGCAGCCARGEVDIDAVDGRRDLGASSVCDCPEARESSAEDEPELVCVCLKGDEDVGDTVSDVDGVFAFGCWGGADDPGSDEAESDELEAAFGPETFRSGCCTICSPFCDCICGLLNLANRGDVPITPGAFAFRDDADDSPLPLPSLPALTTVAFPSPKLVRLCWSR